MGIVQIAVIGVMGVLLAVQFKNGKSEYGIFISIVLSVFVFFSILGRVEVILSVIREISQAIGVKSAYFILLLKMLGVSYVAEFASSICKDAGYETIASQIEIFSKITILALSMPVLQALLETIQLFLE